VKLTTYMKVSSLSVLYYEHASCHSTMFNVIWQYKGVLLMSADSCRFYHQLNVYSKFGSWQSCFLLWVWLYILSHWYGL